jgi:hypothetical protein
MVATAARLRSNRNQHGAGAGAGFRVGFCATRLCAAWLLTMLAAQRGHGYKTACQRRRSVAQPGRAPRSGRGGRRFKSCHSDQYLAKIKMLAGTDCGTVSHVVLAFCAQRSPTDGGTSAARRPAEPGVPRWRYAEALAEGIKEEGVEGECAEGEVVEEEAVEGGVNSLYAGEPSSRP